MTSGLNGGDPSVLIIGGGVAGLAAACYARMNGFNALVLEAAPRPGGLCTAWRRSGYTFDGCLRWLMGTIPSDRFYQVWRELGVIPGCEMIAQGELCRVTDDDGRELIIHGDAERLGDHLKQLSPRDGALIDELVAQTTALAALPFRLGPPRELLPSGHLSRDLTELRPLILALRRREDDGTLAGFAARFGDPFLRAALPAVFDVPRFSVVAAELVLAGFHRGDGAVPRGGSLALTGALTERLAGLGGELRCGAPVEAVLVEGDRAVGVRLEDGCLLRADQVISAADGRRTLFSMLEGRPIPLELRRWYDRWPLFPPQVQVSLGVRRDLSAEPRSRRLLLTEPLIVAGAEVSRLTVARAGAAGAMAPPGHSALLVSFSSSFDRWRALTDRQYALEKARVAEAVIARLEGLFSGLSAEVEVIDVATPLTTYRHTGNWRGSPEGWAPTPEAMEALVRGAAVSRSLPGLAGFSMVGHWVEPGGGLPAVAASAREVIELICHRLGRPFRTGLA